MAKPKKRGGTVAGRTAVAVDQGMKKAWQLETERLRKAEAGEYEGWDEKYEAIGAILDGKLYLAGGLRSESEFFRKYLPGVDARSAWAHVAVAQHFEPEDEAKYQPTKLRLLLEYLAAAGGTPNPPAKIHPERQKVVVPEKGHERRIPFPETTTQQLQAAISRARHLKAKPGPTAPPIVKAAGAVLAKKKIRGVGVALRGGLLVISVAPKNARAAFRALAAAELPID